MSSSGHGFLGFLAGIVIGGAAGVAAGLLMAPRPGVETRDRVAQEANQAWSSVVDTYQKSAQEVTQRAGEASADLGVRTDELREKVDAARARMEQLRANLAESMAAAEEPAPVNSTDEPAPAAAV